MYKNTTLALMFHRSNREISRYAFDKWLCTSAYELSNDLSGIPISSASVTSNRYIHNQHTDLAAVPRSLAATAAFGSVRFAAAIAVVLVINLRMFTVYKVI